MLKEWFMIFIDDQLDQKNHINSWFSLVNYV